MDEFEIFKARASGCEIRVEDFDPSEVFQRRSPRDSLRSEGTSDDLRRSTRRKSIKKNTKRPPDDENEGSLQVKVEIQPPSPVACRKLSDQMRSGIDDLQSINSIDETFRSNGRDGGVADEPRKFESNFEAGDGTRQRDRQVHVGCSSAEMRRSRHSFAGSSSSSCCGHGNEASSAGNEFVSSNSCLDAFQRSKSCRHRRSKQSDDRRCSEAFNFTAGRHDGESTPPAVYRVRSFTTKKGEIVSRGDSFKVCTGGSTTNGQFLLVDDGRSLQRTRRSSAVVPGGSFSRLEVCQPAAWGSNANRRKSTTCLNPTMAEERRISTPTFDCRRKSSTKIDEMAPLVDDAGDRRASSPSSSVREGLPREAFERLSNKSLEPEEATFCLDDRPRLPPPQEYHVTVLGHPGVGKTTLINQLMTSEYLANKEQNDQGEEEGDNVVSVLLDGIESAVHFQEGSCILEEEGAEVESDAYLLVFSVTERASLAYIQTCLHDILKNDKRLHDLGARTKSSSKLRFHRQKQQQQQQPPSSSSDGGTESSDRDKRRLDRVVEERRPPKPVLYLLANKQDLVRNRVVTEADVRRSMETKKNKCKYAEASALLDHKVDEVLVDLVREIRSRATCSEQEDSDIEDLSGRGCLQQAMVGFCGKLFK